jgi:molybdenum cofactor cytidylyltransferase
MKIGVIVLAAGASQRMGRPKQSLVLEDGRSLLQTTVETALATTLRPVVVVVGANKGEVVPELKGQPVTIIDNSFWEEGMASSVKMGLAGLYITDPKLDGVLILVCDQPYLTPELLDAMVAKYKDSGKKAVACRYQDQWGVPVLIGRELLTELMDLTGEQGAKPMLKKHKEDLAFVKFDKGIIDLDTPMDFEKYQSN